VVALPVVCGGRRCYWGAEGGRGGGASPSPSSPSSASFFFLFFSSFLFSSLLFSLPSPLCSSLVLFSLFSWSPLFFPGSCFFISPVFIEKQGRDTAGAPLCCRPSTARPTRGKLLGKWVSLVNIFLMLLRGRKSVKTGGRKIFFFPCLARLGEEEDPQCRQNGTVSGFFFW